MSDYIFEIPNFNATTDFKVKDDILVWTAGDLSIKYVPSINDIRVSEDGSEIFSFKGTLVPPDRNLQLTFASEKPDPRIYLNSNELKFSISCDNDCSNDNEKYEKVIIRDKNGDVEKVTTGYRERTNFEDLNKNRDVKEIKTGYRERISFRDN